MLRVFFRLSIGLVLAAGAFSQNTSVPVNVADLVKRATEFRRLLSAGDRVKASTFVSAAKRNDFLNRPIPALPSPKALGVDFVDSTEAGVRFSGQAILSSG